MKTILAFAKAAIHSNTAYRGAIVVWMIVSLIRIAVALFIWLTAENQVLGGYTKPEIISYYIIVMFFDWILMWTPFQSVTQEIKSGSIVSYLIKPVSYLKSWLGREFGFKIVAISILTIVGAPLIITLKSANIPIYLNPNWQWLFLILSIPGAIAISFLITMCMALLGFWFTEVRYVNYVYWTLMPLLGGLFLPTSFLPAGIEKFNWLLPFRYHLSLSMEILLHRLTPTETIVSLGLMSIWVIALFRLYLMIWRNGVKNYSAFGQ